MKNVLSACASAGGNETSLSDLKDFYYARQGKLEKSLGASGEGLSDADCCIKEVKDNKNVPAELAGMVNEAEARFRRFEKNVLFLEDRVRTEQFVTCNAFFFEMV